MYNNILYKFICSNIKDSYLHGISYINMRLYELHTNNFAFKSLEILYRDITNSKWNDKRTVCRRPLTVFSWNRIPMRTTQCVWLLVSCQRKRRGGSGGCIAQWNTVERFIAAIPNQLQVILNLSKIKFKKKKSENPESLQTLWIIRQNVYAVLIPVHSLTSIEL